MATARDLLAPFTAEQLIKMVHDGTLPRAILESPAAMELLQKRIDSYNARMALLNQIARADFDVWMQILQSFSQR